MNKRNARFVGLAAVATLLAGCVAQYRNPSACEDEMRQRLADGTHGTLSVTHSAVAYRGERVVVEGRLDNVPQAASGVSAASGAAAGSDAEAVPLQAASAPVAASGAASAAVATAASAASGTEAGPKPTTPVGVLTQKLGLKKPVRTPAAAECTFNESGLTSFRWLAPPALAKTTPDPNASDD
jgi:hypothetical protein